MAKSPKDVCGVSEEPVKIAAGNPGGDGRFHEEAHAGCAERRRSDYQGQGTHCSRYRGLRNMRLLYRHSRQKCFEAGATREEIAEVLGIAILMGGGPAV